jgi:hypothetical protein
MVTFESRDKLFQALRESRNKGAGFELSSTAVPYKSVEEVVAVPGFEGTPEELDTLLAEGLASKQLTDDEFWSSVSKRTDALLAEHKTGPRS